MMLLNTPYSKLASRPTWQPTLVISQNHPTAIDSLREVTCCPQQLVLSPCVPFTANTALP